MKSILKVSTIIISLITGIVFQANAHSETVANLSVEYAEDGLTITASLEKRHLSLALIEEANCSPKDMLRICANIYVKENIEVIINDKRVFLKRIGQRMTRDNIIITYKVFFKKEIESIVVKSDYMIKYNDHSKVKVVSKLTTENKRYSLSATRKQIMILL